MDFTNLALKLNSWAVWLSDNYLLVILIFIIFMMALFLVDFITHIVGKRRDFKSVIVSVGVLGTFVGIFAGLWGFDSTNVEGSVPKLLDGLKTAFFTSIVGMALAILLSILQKIASSDSGEDEVSALNSINKKLELLADIKKSTNHMKAIPLINTKLELLTDIKKNTNHLETIPLINTKLESVDGNIKTLSIDMASIKEELPNSRQELFKFLQEKLGTIDDSLKKAVETMARGATEEIIKALEQVIADFNNNLTEQFGDNFKRLNEAVLKTIEWQENYKESIQKFEESLKETLAATEGSNRKTVEFIGKSLVDFTENNKVAIDTSIRKIKEIAQATDERLDAHVQAVMETVKQVNETTVAAIEKESKVMSDTMQNANRSVLETTQEQNELAKQLLTQLEASLTHTIDSAEQMEKVAKDYQSIADVSEKLRDIIKSNQRQIADLEVHLTSLAKVGDEAGKITEELQNFSNTVQSALKDQMDVVTRMTRDIEEKLPGALDAMEKTLVSLTKEFAQNYEKFLKQFENVNHAGDRLSQMDE